MPHHRIGCKMSRRVIVRKTATGGPENRPAILPSEEKTENMSSTEAIEKGVSLVSSRLLWCFESDYRDTVHALVVGPRRHRVSFSDCRSGHNPVTLSGPAGRCAFILRVQRAPFYHRNGAVTVATPFPRTEILKSDLTYPPEIPEVFLWRHVSDRAPVTAYSTFARGLAPIA